MAMYSIETRGQLHPHLEQEWLLTNGLGAFASSSIVGCNTRRYHGLLCAATLPPVGRVLALNRIGETLVIDGQPRAELAVNQFNQTFHPRGDQFLRSFEFDGGVAKWVYDADGVRVTKEVQLVWMRNLAGIRYTVEPSSGKSVQLRLQPFVSLRDFHALIHDQPAFDVRPGDKQVEVSRDGKTLHLRADVGTFEHGEDWWYNHTYAIETDRGQDDAEHLFTPGEFVVDISGKTVVTLWAGMEAAGGDVTWDAMLKLCPDPTAPAREANRIPKPTRPVEKLLRAAADFIVARKSPDGFAGTTIIAGYPWFSDWGRDTMISLPGLMLVTGRYAAARQVLSVFSQYVSQGMIPNRFDDYTNEPEYNTVDASLWFIHAAFEYLKATSDKKTFDSTLRPACQKIIAGYKAGTRYKIAMDPADGLITQGDEQTQLTWMDAKCGDTAFTPRQGKPIEINALWYHSLMLMGEKDLAAKVAGSIRTQFWISPFRGLADTINNGQQDQSLRPNQIFAVSLEHSPLTPEQQQAVVEVVRRELLTPVGLRSLARSDPKYKASYRGDQWSRDGAYHNGTVWSWLIGPFVEAYLRVNNHSEAAANQARYWLSPLVDGMDREACIGQISEIYEPEAPYRPVGCCAQAWSIAEVLRLAVHLKM